MILFLKDWDDYPDAVIHWDTPNKSFLEIAKLYRAMGCKNYAFMLALHDPSLRHVNPHAKDLDAVTMAAIKVEARHNPWYFFREIARVKPQAGPNPVPFRANRGNIATIWCFFTHIEPFLIQPRQTGKSVTADMLALYLIDIGTVNTWISMLTKDDKTRVSNVLRLKGMRTYIPEYLSEVTKLDANNTVELTCKALGNMYSTAVAQASEAGADSIGRGLTSPIVLFDEVPYCTHIQTTMSTMIASTGAATDEAKAVGAHYGVIYTTTAGRKDTPEGRFAYDILNGGMVWTEVVFDSKDEKDLHKTVRLHNKDRGLVMNITMSHRQLGYTDEWLREKIVKSKGDRDKVNRDFFNIWTSGGLSSPLAPYLNELIRNSQREVTYNEISRDGYILRWYLRQDEIESYMRNNHVVLGMDTSEAIGRDAISMVLVNVKNLEVIAASAINETNILRFSAYIADFMIRFRNVTLIPERRSTGGTLISTLLLRLPAVGIDPFERIYNTIVDDMDRDSDDGKFAFTDLARRPVQRYDSLSRYFGFATSGSGRHTRHTLYSEGLQTGAKMGGRGVHDKELINEITGLVVKKERIDHSGGSHDDMVIGWLLTIWFLSMSRNLHHYGISGAMTQCIEHGSPNQSIKPPTRFDLREKELQNSIKAEIDTLLQQLQSVHDDYIAMKIEHRIRSLDGRLKSNHSDSISMDGLIKDAKDNRVKVMRERRRNIEQRGNVSMR